MAQFIAFIPNVEVNGQTIISVIDGMGEFKGLALTILAENGIPDPRPGEWYPQQWWLNAFKYIAEKLGPFTLRNIGTKIPENADWPPEINTIEAALASIDIAYHMNHRLNGEVLYNPQTKTMNEGIGHYEFEKIDERQVRMICENPYPCDFDKGIIEAVAKKFRPEDSITLSVVHDDSKPCRKKERRSCTYLVSW